MWKVEDVLEVYTRPCDAERPLVCMYETSKQQMMEVRPPHAMKQGLGRRYDTEYKRNGVSNLFMFFAPLEGWWHVKVTDRRTKIDWALAMRDLVDEHFSEAKIITVVMDNLNTHNPSSLYEVFAPEEAKRILSRLELHYTPKHSIWLNMSEIELSIRGRQCLSRRIPGQQTLRHKVAAWEKARNAKSSSID